MKMFYRRVAVIMLILMAVAFVSPYCMYARAQSLDDIGGTTQDGSGQSSGDDDSAIADYLRDYNPVTEQNMAQAGQLASPIASALGTVTGFIMICVSAAIFTITALDLAYIGIPPLRPTLNPNEGMQGGGGAAGGMGMGGMGMRGGMGMGGGGEAPRKRRWISDEALLAVSQSGVDQQGGAAGGMGMGGMGMGMGGMGMGGMQGGQQQQQNTKSAIFTYLKKRAIFLVIFALCSVILLSSVFTDCGINLALLGQKVMNKLNGQITEVDV